MGPPRRIDPTTHCTISERSYHGSTSRSLGTRSISMGPPRRIDPITHLTMSELSYRGASSRSLGTRNSSMGPPRRIDPMTHRTKSERSYHWYDAYRRCVVNIRPSLVIREASQIHFRRKNMMRTSSNILSFDN